MTPAPAPAGRLADAATAAGRVSLVTLGCGRNDVDSDQIAGALSLAGLTVVDEPDEADVVVVNTCTFIAPARAESIDTVLSACDLRRADGRRAQVLVIGCMAQRYGDELAEALPEAAGVLGFADYPRLPSIVATLLAGGTVADAPPDALPMPDASLGRAPVDASPVALPGVSPARGAPRRGLPLVDIRSTSPAPATATAPFAAPVGPPTAAFPVRTEPRGPWAYLKVASGCDRVCTFCTIPSYRGRFASRPVDELLAEAGWLAASGVRELVCVSENTTSWGKDLPEGRRALLELIAGFERIDGLARVRLLYLQPAELLPELLDAMAASPVVAGYYDLSLQHASGPVLRRMGRSGDAERFLDLVDGIRARDPQAVFRSSFITGFPGERDADVDQLEQFLAAARLDWAGFFCFSPEDGTPAADLPEQVPPGEARVRRDRLVDVAEAVAEDAAEQFVGRQLQVLVLEREPGAVAGVSYREAPETDGEVRVSDCDAPIGSLVPVRVLTNDGVDLVAAPLGPTPGSSA